MTAYLARRFALACVTLVIVSMLVFFMLRILPGDVATLILQGPDSSGTANQQDVAQLKEQLGLNQPLLVQYFDWARHLMVFDLGKSLWTNGSIAQELKAKLPLTIELTLLASVLTVVVGIPLGVVSALRPGAWPDTLGRLFTAVG